MLNIFNNYRLNYDPDTGNSEVINIKYNKTLKIYVDKYGYKRVQLRLNGKNKQVRIHSIIAKHFLDLKEGLCVNHINGIKTDNRLSNLELLTRGENIKHGYKIGLFPKREPKDANYSKKYYNKNKEQILKRVNDYRIKNHELINKKKREAYYKNKGCNLKPAMLCLELELNKQEF